jgi:hypothetical protein
MEPPKEISVEDEELEKTRLDELTIDISNNPRDRISKREHQVLQQLKEHPIAQGLDDRYLMIFLLGRKLNLTRTIELLTLNKKFLEDNGYVNRQVKIEDLNQELARTMYSFNVPGCRDIEGHYVAYIIPARVFLKRYTVKEQLDLFMFHWGRFLLEPLDGHRKGFVFIEDLANVGLSNFDTKNGAELNKAVQNHFPIRIAGILILNPGTIIKVLLKIAKLFIKKKILQRVMTISHADIEKYIEKSQLIDTFGGSVHYGFEEFARGDFVLEPPVFINPPVSETPKAYVDQD